MKVIIVFGSKTIQTSWSNSLGQVFVTATPTENFAVGNQLQLSVSDPEDYYYAITANYTITGIFSATSNFSVEARYQLTFNFLNGTNVGIPIEDLLVTIFVSAVQVGQTHTNSLGYATFIAANKEFISGSHVTFTVFDPTDTYNVTKGLPATYFTLALTSQEQDYILEELAVVNIYISDMTTGSDVPAPNMKVQMMNNTPTFTTISTCYTNGTGYCVFASALAFEFDVGTILKIVISDPRQLMQAAQ